VGGDLSEIEDCDTPWLCFCQGSRTQVHATPLQTLAAFSIALALIGLPSAPFPLSGDSLTSSCRVNRVLKNLITGKEVSCKGQPPTPAREPLVEKVRKIIPYFWQVSIHLFIFLASSRRCLQKDMRESALRTCLYDK
jgi:hypothetical protein